MKTTNPFSLIAFLVVLFPISIWAQTYNVLSLPNGAYIHSAPPTFKSVPETSNLIVPWTKEALFDGTSRKGWRSREAQGFPMEFVIELSELCVIEKLGVNNDCENKYPGLCAKDIEVQFSTTSPESGFETVGKYTIPEYASDIYHNIDPRDARWIKIIIHSNYGSKSYTELMEVEAFGHHKNENVKAIDLTGDWESTWGLASFKQNGFKINGCYQYRNGIIENAGMDRRILTYKWVEEGENGIGRAVMVVNEEGDRLNGIWGFGDNLNSYGIWVFRKKSDTPTLCHVSDTDVAIIEEEEENVVDRMKEELDLNGKLIVHGINFTANSSVIQEGSYPALDEIADLMKKHPDVKLRVEGHTDETGSPSYSLKLSQSRAESVVRYLITQGIAEARLSAKGKGETEPIADNSTRLGRAANRRVEFFIEK